MCLGLTATITAIIKLTEMTYQNFNGDELHDLLIPTMWCMLEEVIGVTAVSIPYLKAPIERTLQRLGCHLVTNNHQPSLAEVRCPPTRICAVEEASESGHPESDRDKAECRRQRECLARV